MKAKRCKITITSFTGVRQNECAYSQNIDRDHLLDRTPVDEGSLGGVFGEPVADLQRPNLLAQSLDELVVDAALNQQAVRTHARLKEFKLI